VLDSPDVAPTHIQILFGRRFFNLEEVDKAAEILINGKKKASRTPLAHDRLQLGAIEVVFSLLGDHRS